ncbi:MAG: hypothetical protein ACI9R3_004896 [Verrucomicrobiales bacterium]|jgi:hypothetical protein
MQPSAVRMPGNDLTAVLPDRQQVKDSIWINSLSYYCLLADGRESLQLQGRPLGLI